MTQLTRHTVGSDAGAARGAWPCESWRMLARRQSAGRRLPKGLDAWWDALAGRLTLMLPRTGRFLARAERVLQLGEALSQLSDARLRERAQECRELSRLGRLTRERELDAMAVVREAASRSLGMLAYREQVAGALAMNAGCIAEMATGEGKSLTAGLLGVLAGWRGRGCHVVTVNDYLAQRDAQTLGPLYRACGVTVASIADDTPPDQRRVAYHCDVTYCTNKDVAADFLRDRLALGRIRRLPPALFASLAQGRGAGADRLLMRGLETAVIDEADSILIDEAVTPLIISADSPNAEREQAFLDAASFVKRLRQGVDFRVDLKHRELTLTRAGRDLARELAQTRGGIWAGARRREELITQALTASVFYRRDQQYVVEEGKVVIVDESTGRLMPDRTWRDGMHQAVEAKEGLTVNTPKETLARISFQRFFRMYRRLCGMTGTAWEARHELWQVYHLKTCVIPTHRPRLRVQAPDQVFATQGAKWEAAARHVAEVHATGRPVLVGTRTVEESERLSELLAGLKLPHLVLNAVRHKEEAEVVAQAGGRGKITVATNMAGRGTDIKLAPGVAELGGLHVLATTRHSTRRVDRQLSGRAGRQGDPGSAVAFVSLEDDLLQRYAGRVARRLAARHAGRAQPMPARSLLTLIGRCQDRAERLARQQRRGVLRSDDWVREFLGFAGAED